MDVKFMTQADNEHYTPAVVARITQSIGEYAGPIVLDTNGQSVENATIIWTIKNVRGKQLPIIRGLISGYLGFSISLT